MNRRNFLYSILLGPLAPHLQRLADLLPKKPLLPIDISKAPRLKFLTAHDVRVWFRNENGEEIDVSGDILNIRGPNTQQNYIDPFVNPFSSKDIDLSFSGTHSYWEGEENNVILRPPDHE